MEEKIKRLILNYINTKRSWDAWWYMSWTGPMDESTGLSNLKSSPKAIVDQNDLLTYSRYLAWKDFHIEISKIVTYSKHKDDIYSLLRKFSDNNPQRKQEVNKNINDLDSLKNVIENIIKRRNNVYAHLGPDHKLYGGLGAVDPYEKLFETLERAIETLTSKEELDEIKSRQPIYFFAF
jgi:hypothetical protein